VTAEYQQRPQACSHIHTKLEQVTYDMITYMNLKRALTTAPPNKHIQGDFDSVHTVHCPVVIHYCKQTN
jgi:hypothetical protein